MDRTAQRRPYVMMWHRLPCDWYCVLCAAGHSPDHKPKWMFGPSGFAAVSARRHPDET